jgi:hypothetical protein
MELSESFPFKLPRVIHVDLNGKDCKAVEGHYGVMEVGDDDLVIHHVYDKKMYYSMEVIERLMSSERTESEKLRSVKALVNEYELFEKKLMELFEEAEKYNSRSS